MISRSLSAVYCDDVRQEAGNKLSYMGVYGQQLLIPQFPITLPRLFVILTAVTSQAQPFKSLSFKVLFDDSVMLESGNVGPIPTPPENDGKDPSSKAMVAGIIFGLGPLVIESPAILRVRAQTESEELKAPALRIESTPVSMSAPTVEGPRAKPGFTRVTFEGEAARVGIRIPVSPPDQTFVELNMIVTKKDIPAREIQALAMEEAAATLTRLAAATRKVGNA